ncbi:hypothetical protein EKK58_04030 [Candidatus Dependentiae bacterium]|nr:MAG: hypothetical protein EKK58_04030 [Candidatus Dependentiae bacterium]
MFFKKKLIILNIIVSCSAIVASQKSPVSYLELFPGKGLEPVFLGHPYSSITPEEKKNCLLLQETCYTVLDNNSNHCALVGPLQPCQLLLLDFGKKTVVAHISSQSNLQDLLNKIKEEHPNIDSSTITGELFTNDSLTYDQEIFTTKGLTYKKLYQGRSQLQELKKNKDAIINTLNIPNRNQINALKFKSTKEDFALGNYEFAELFVLIKMINQKPAIFNTCPMAEEYFGNFSDLPIRERFAENSKLLNKILSPAFVNFQNKDAAYGKIPFYYISPNIFDTYHF